MVYEGSWCSRAMCCSPLPGVGKTRHDGGSGSRGPLKIPFIEDGVITRTVLTRSVVIPSRHDMPDHSTGDASLPKPHFELHTHMMHNGI
jgi:hypothetical protein